MTTSRPSGFTLLEVLVMLVVLGLLLGVLTQGTRLAFAVRAAQDRQVRGIEELETADRAIRHLINTMDPALTSDLRPHLVANVRSMGFTANLPAETAYPTQQADVILLVDDEHRLVLRWAPHYAAPLGPPPLPHLTTLLDGVDRVELSYWAATIGPDGALHGGGWTDRWNAQKLPSLVRVRIVFLKGDRRHWPDIVAATATE